MGCECLYTVRGALSSLGIVVDAGKVGSHPLVVRFMSGVSTLGLINQGTLTHGKYRN